MKITFTSIISEEKQEVVFPHRVQVLRVVATVHDDFTRDTKKFMGEWRIPNPDKIILTRLVSGMIAQVMTEYGLPNMEVEIL